MNPCVMLVVAVSAFQYLPPMANAADADIPIQQATNLAPLETANDLPPLPLSHAAGSYTFENQFPIGFSEVTADAGSHYEGSDDCCDDCDSCGEAEPACLFMPCRHAWKLKCCKSCRSTCDMLPHYPYQPRNHGYFSYSPYNYTHVLFHRENAEAMGSDSISPYTTDVFEKVYAETYEEPETVDDPMTAPSRITEPLPNLQELLEESK